MPLPFLGFGVGLRTRHYDYILKHWPKVDWFEAISENYMIAGGRPLFILDQVRERYPVVLHGVSLSIGSKDPIDKDYLKTLKKLIHRVRPPWVSDHLCWTGVGGKNVHDLLPLPYTEECLRHVVKRVKEVQDFLERRILLENVSSYMEFENSSLTEWDFLARISEEADCGILLDVNNIYVSSVNHSFDPLEYLNGLPPDRVTQFHLAGHSNKGKYLLDTHDHPVKTSVWDLYAKALDRFGSVSTMIERDDRIPPLPKLLEELEHAKKIHQNRIHAKTSPSARNAAPLAEAHYGT
ncbi:MAG: DUF692 domain-containing protein [bacterium]